MRTRVLFLFLFSMYSASWAAEGPLLRGESNVFGVAFRWFTADSETNEWFRHRLAAMHRAYSVAWDPFCYYRPLEQGKCKVPLPDVYRDILAMADSVRAETDGHFNVHVGAKLDFGGIAQGFLLEQLSRSKTGAWIGDFAGDVYISPEFHGEISLAIADPLLEALPFAKVSMPHGGWMIAGTSADFGAKMRLPKGTSGGRDFQRVVLFADSDFNGARLDAWATAIIAGGRKTLNYLAANETYQGRWAYLYFDGAGRAVCSDRLQCDFRDPQRRSVIFRSRSTPPARR